MNCPAAGIINRVQLGGDQSQFLPGPLHAQGGHKEADLPGARVKIQVPELSASLALEGDAATKKLTDSSEHEGWTHQGVKLFWSCGNQQA